MTTITYAFDLFDKWVSDGCEYHPQLISELQSAFAEARAEVERLRADRLTVAEAGARTMQEQCIQAECWLCQTGYELIDGEWHRYGTEMIRCHSRDIRALDVTAIARRAVDGDG